MPLNATVNEPLYITGDPGVTDMTFKQERAVFALFSSGVGSSTDFLVEPASGGGMSVQARAGTALVAGTTDTSPTGQQKYLVPNSTTRTLGTITAPTGATRTDDVVLVVYDRGDDAANAAGLAEAQVAYRVNGSTGTGTPPTLGANMIRLATVAVTVGAASITAGMITDARQLWGPLVPGLDGTKRRVAVDAGGGLYLPTEAGAAGAGVPLVTALPTTGLFEGREVYYRPTSTVNGVAGVTLPPLHCRYNATSAKWDVLGGQWFAGLADTAASSTWTANTWTEPSTTPGIVLPCNADVDYQATVRANNNVAGIVIAYAFCRAGSETLPAVSSMNEHGAYAYMTASLAEGGQLAWAQTKTGVASGALVRLVYATSVPANNVSFGFNRSLVLVPKRVW